jgi:2-oxoglutarate dehydrogenase E1 component
MGQDVHEFEVDPAQDAPQQGPSWQSPRWPITDALAGDDLTRALDPMALKVEVAKAAKKAGAALDEAALEQAASDSLRVMLLVRTYRVRGHLAADLDPLGLSKQDLPADLSPEYHGFTAKDMDRKIFLGGTLGLQWGTVREVVDILRKNYCGKIGLNTCTSPTWKSASSSRTASKAATSRSTSRRRQEGDPLGRGARRAVREVPRQEVRRHQALRPRRRRIDDPRARSGDQVRRPARREGNHLRHGPPRPPEHSGQRDGQALSRDLPRILGGSANPEDVGGSGDVKYHLGTSTDREFDGTKVHMSLLPNPSHLETVDPIVLGKTLAQQQFRDDVGPGKHKQVLPVLIHGDAAFAGQGIVWECFGFSGVEGYNTGGCIHFIINNQIGFTTSPQFSRGSPYPSDVAKGVQAPIIHVNGDDPEAVTFACKLAIDYRQQFGRDIVLDMWCYRRFGHNEGDEPSFTQPLMYAKIKKHPAVSSLYAERLVAEGVIDKNWKGEAEDHFTATLENEFEAAKSYKANEADWFGGRWAGLNKPADPVTARRNVATGIEQKLFDSLGRTLTAIPEGLTVHKTLGRVLDAKREMFNSGAGFDWATAEALAYGSLVTEGYNVRLSGQDCGRGTFSQRHAVWVDQTDEHKYVPLSTLPHGRFDVLDSPLSEYGVLGFEYGYASADPKTLVLWEAQFGDFANGAQIVIDQYIAASEAKWLRANGLVMLLPHGYEGQGPEHSSARLERYLQLCAEDNLQVCNITSPANYFHVLRRQMHRSFRKPLIIMTPKSLLRHPLAKSSAEDFLGEAQFKRILSDPSAPEDKDTRRVVLCSGKVAYDLIEARDAAGITDTQIIRIEQLYPFPGEPLALRLSRMANLEDVVWCQEEPKNNGSWFFAEPLVEEALKAAKSKVGRARYAGRSASASPATGLAKRHNAEQAALVADALALSVREEIRRKKKA